MQMPTTAVNRNVDGPTAVGTVRVSAYLPAHGNRCRNSGWHVKAAELVPFEHDLLGKLHENALPIGKLLTLSLGKVTEAARIQHGKPPTVLGTVQALHGLITTW